MPLMAVNSSVGFGAQPWRLITETINTLFLLISLKCVVTEVVLFSVVDFQTSDISQGSVAVVVGCLVIVLLQIFS